jgi:molybdopterin synthase sulfur carrier subunit
MPVTLRYFAWVRERIGRAEEQVELPPELVTVDDLLQWLKMRGPEYAHAFERAGVIRTAVDQVHETAGTIGAHARSPSFHPSPADE